MLGDMSTKIEPAGHEISPKPILMRGEHSRLVRLRPVLRSRSLAYFTAGRETLRTFCDHHDRVLLDRHLVDQCCPVGFVFEHGYLYRAVRALGLCFVSHGLQSFVALLAVRRSGLPLLFLKVCSGRAVEAGR